MPDDPKRRREDFLEMDEHTVLASMAATLAEVREKTDRLYEILYGNGEAGLKTRVALVEERYSGLLAKLDETRKTLLWLGGVIIILLVNLVWQIITHQITFP